MAACLAGWLGGSARAQLNGDARGARLRRRALLLLAALESLWRLHVHRGEEADDQEEQRHGAEEQTRDDTGRPAVRVDDRRRVGDVGIALVDARQLDAASATRGVGGEVLEWTINVNI